MSQPQLTDNAAVTSNGPALNLDSLPPPLVGSVSSTSPPTDINNSSAASTLQQPQFYFPYFPPPVIGCESLFSASSSNQNYYDGFVPTAPPENGLTENHNIIPSHLLFTPTNGPSSFLTSNNNCFSNNGDRESDGVQQTRSLKPKIGKERETSAKTTINHNNNNNNSAANSCLCSSPTTSNNIDGHTVNNNSSATETNASHMYGSYGATSMSISASLANGCVLYPSVDFMSNKMHENDGGSEKLQVSKIRATTKCKEC